MKTIRYILLLSTVITAFIIAPTWAYADGCTQYSIMLPDGRMLICQQCCYGGQCQINCL
jgi:hypothetical protein